MRGVSISKANRKITRSKSGTKKWGGIVIPGHMISDRSSVRKDEERTRSYGDSNAN